MKLTCCVGIPGSGKSTWAREQCNLDPSITRVNKDDIRDDLSKTGWKWSRDGEKAVVKIRDQQIIDALTHNRDVISDDTNFAIKHQQRLKQLADQYCAEFEIKFFEVDVEEAIRRDAARERSVGERVIRQMAEQYLTLVVVSYKEDPALPWCVMCDLDGTAALIGTRSPYDGGSCHLDTPNIPVRKVLRAMDLTVVYMSGRDDAHYSPTVRWLYDHGFPDGAVHMRATGDKRKDSVVKGELFNAHIRGVYNVAFVLDDRDSVVAYWRSIGLTCFQVAPGAF